MHILQRFNVWKLEFWSGFIIYLECERIPLPWTVSLGLILNGVMIIKPRMPLLYSSVVGTIAPSETADLPSLLCGGRRGKIVWRRRKFTTFPCLLSQTDKTMSSIKTRHSSGPNNRAWFSCSCDIGNCHYQSAHTEVAKCLVIVVLLIWDSK